MKHQTEHYESQVFKKLVDMERCLLENYVWQLEEPRVGQSYPNYYKGASLLAVFGQVVLSGCGGDLNYLVDIPGDILNLKVELKF